MKIKSWNDKKFCKVKEDIEEYFYEVSASKNKAVNHYPKIIMILSQENKEAEKRDPFSTKEDIECCLNSFMEIMMIINKYTVFIPIKPVFCFYMGWNTEFYENLKNNGVREVAEMMSLVDDYIVSNIYSAMQAGIIKYNAGQAYLSDSSSVGHKKVAQKEQMINDRVQKKIKTPEELEKEFNLMRGNIGILENKEKNKNEKSKRVL